MPDLLAGLNPEQLAAVTLPPQHALILAGAGSGKTRVLTTRIAWLISTGQVSPQGVIAVTFTNKAAKEMLARLSALLPINTRGMWVGTFHGLCNRLLRAHHRDAGLPATFQILDVGDQLSAIKRLMKQLQIDDEKFPPKQVQNYINTAKDRGQRPDALDAYDPFSRRMIEIYKAYDEQCQREGVVDFAELLLRCKELLERSPALRHHYQARFRHVLIDEFQDTNELQYGWLSLLSGQGNALFAVGDDDQSIYAFRGANSGNMFRFEREFAQGQLIKLEQNYRSSGHILEAANHLIRNNRERLGKTLWTSMGEGEPVRVRESTSDLQESAWVVEEIGNQVREGRMRADCAILYRSNAQSRVFEHALFSAGIPYRVFGGQRFFERAEIKHALAYLRLIDNPDDDTAFLRVVNFPPRGIGARSIEQLQDVARERGISLHASAPLLGGRAGTTVLGFVQLLERMRNSAIGLPLQDMVEAVVALSGLIEHYQAEKEGQERVDNLSELVTAAANFTYEQGWQDQAPAALGVTGDGFFLSGDDAPAPRAAMPAVLSAPDQIVDADDVSVAMTPLTAFLTHASLEAGDTQAGEGRDAVQLMTVHASKGLEFPLVFLVGLEDGLFPHEQSAADPDGLEEERRLLYVAITRARERLYLSFAATRMLHGQTRYCVKSRFVDELPEGSMKWLTPKFKQDRWSSAVESTIGFASAPSLPRGNSVSKQAPLTAMSSTGEEHPLRVGQQVRHARFGDGVIIKLEGRGDDARAQINFGRQGIKMLALAVAKLDRI